MCWQQPRLKETQTGSWQPKGKPCRICGNGRGRELGLFVFPDHPTKPLRRENEHKLTCMQGQLCAQYSRADWFFWVVQELNGDQVIGLAWVLQSCKTEPLGGLALKSQHKDTQRFTPTKKPVFSWNTYFTTLVPLSPFAVLLKSRVSEFWLRVTGKVTHKSYTEYSLENLRLFLQA